LPRFAVSPFRRFAPLLVLAVLGMGLLAGSASAAEVTNAFTVPLGSYGDSQMTGLWNVLQHRVRQQPLNLWASLLFLGAILHTFFTHRFLHWAHRIEERQRKGNGETAKRRDGEFAGAPTHPLAVSPGAAARLLHFLGEVEVVFGIWCVPLFVVLAVKLGWHPAVNYFSHVVRYVEPVFVVVIMSIASTRPVLDLAETCLRFAARLGGGGPAAWWLAILTLGPVLGSLITEPAAMTISALLLSKQFYALKPSPRLAYATLGLLFVNISVGGVFTHFAAPPVLMVAGPWGWTTPFMVQRFGGAALSGMVLANAIYFFALRKEFSRLAAAAPPAEAGKKAAPVPAWITLAHLAFMFWSVLSAHYPALLIGGFLFFLAFYEVTQDHQSELQLRSPILVGFFLAGLVIHGGLQPWWLGPVLGRLEEVPLLLGAAGLTAFNDNAAITYLATLVPDLGEAFKVAVVEGAVTGGGLTVIANAPNPAGQALLGRFFDGAVRPAALAAAALIPTLIAAAMFRLI
jgi:hypothetical protein